MKTMISDKERREVAATMRATALRGVKGLTLGEVLNSILTGGAPRPTTNMAILARLADLIERPTTTRHGRFKTKYGSRVPLCEVCGYSIGDERWRYCPKCGAEVLDDGE